MPERYRIRKEREDKEKKEKEIELIELFKNYTCMNMNCSNLLEYRTTPYDDEEVITCGKCEEAIDMSEGFLHCKGEECKNFV